MRRSCCSLLCWILAAGAPLAAASLAARAHAEESAPGEEEREAPARDERPADEVPPEPSPAAAEMLKSMREKGILSASEYQDIYRRQAIYEYEEREREKAPPWFQDWVVGGDMRLRLERLDHGNLHLERVIGPLGPEHEGQIGFLEPGKDNVDLLHNKAEGIRDRMRIRFRIGAERKVDEDWTVGFRLATSQLVDLTTDLGNDVTGDKLDKRVVDYRSSNQTLGNYFEPKGIYLDRAYIQYNPSFAPALRLIGGKFENPFRSKYMPYDNLVFDDDIQPEGVAVKYRFDFIPETWWAEANFGFLILNEVGGVDVTEVQPGMVTTTLPDNDDRDAHIFAYQIATYADPYPWMRLGLRGSYYDYRNLSERDAFILADLGNGGDAILQNPAFGELDSTGPCLVDPQTGKKSETCFFQRPRAAGQIKQGVVDAFVTFKPFGERWPITPFFQYTTLLSASTEPNGYGVGLEIGTPDVIQLRAFYARLERNSTVALFTDSDLFDGFTNAKGWYVSAARKLSDHVTLRLSYYSSQVAQPSCVAVVEQDKPSLFCDSAAVIPEKGQFRQTSLEHRKRIQIDLTAEF